MGPGSTFEVLADQTPTVNRTLLGASFDQACQLRFGMTWWMFALGSALAAAATAILAKVGVSGVPSNLATALRTIVVLVFAWAIVVATGDHRSLKTIEPRSLVFLALSGLATGVSWLLYFKALSMAPAALVAPVDKLSVVITVLLGMAILGEQVSWRGGLGVAMIAAGCVLTIKG